jgi:S-DNA-T family DNA segregation ATPase FtsK/SpoIIIE
MSRSSTIPPERWCEILGVLLILLSALLFLALVTDGYEGQVQRPLDGFLTAPNTLGMPGAFTAFILTLPLGHAAHLLYGITALWGASLIRQQPVDRLLSRLAGVTLLTSCIAALFHVNLAGMTPGIAEGGAIGAFLGRMVLPFFGNIGSNIILAALGLVGLLLATEFLCMQLLGFLYKGTIALYRGSVHLYGRLRDAWADRSEARATGAPKESRLEKIRRARAEARAARDVDEDEQYEDDEPEYEPAYAEALDHQAEQVEEVFEDDPTIIMPDSAILAGNEVEDEATDVPALTDEDTILDVAPPPAVPAAPKKPAMPRRKKQPMDELPAGYVYPKRYKAPPLTLLEPPSPKTRGTRKDELERTSRLLEQTFLTFGIEAEVKDVTRGPTITRFELEPAPGIKVSRFINLSDDIALALKAHRVRVEAPIPGKGRVGIEIPNQVREPVTVRDLLESRTFKRGKEALPLAFGRDIAGDVIVADLTKMPHVLVAGATGAGKTVCVKALLASLLFTKTPDELQLIMIDPKMVELSIFQDIPHLITPVVTDARKAATSLSWLINEMEDRFQLFAHLRVRNIDVYNESVDNGEIEVSETEDDEAGSVEAIRKLPYIVCVIDELADLMMLARAETEGAIARLAQLARAVGIHLVIATQRPSVDVLTGVIKANFPARISFQVSSRVDSRCILDEMGAERLIGNGDMLYLPAGQSKPTRIQGAFVSDQEMNDLIAYLKRQAPPQYRDEIENFGKSNEDMGPIEDQDDDLFDDAVRIVLESGQASISMVQRRLRVGYTRAARLIDMMELKGIVGPHLGSKAREILVSTSDTSE